MSSTDITNGIVNFFTDSSLSILGFLFNIIIEIINIILSPLIAIFDFFVPNLGGVIESFTNFIVYMTSIPLDYFISLIPPMTKAMILFMITLKISYYTLIYSYKAIVVVPNLIKRIKFW